MKNKILEELEKNVRDEIGEECEVKFSKVTKNNGSVKQTIIVRRDKEAVCPNIHIDGILNDIENGRMSVHDAAVKITSIYRKADARQFTDIAEKLNKKYILENVVYQVVNTKQNSERLCDMPHKELLDLSVIYKVVVSEDGKGTASIAVSHKFCSMYEIKDGELDIAAKKNTKEKGFCVAHIAEIMNEMAGVSAKELQDECPPMYILTNSVKNNGAAVMIYNEYFKELAEKLKSDLYVMPSSIHEVIAVPDNGFYPDELRKIVTEINMREVANEEILSGNVYKYERETGKLEIA